ncbi:MAG: hypothetical protein M5U35_00090 [Roseovarius sp.]|nr:hypothetical protein [Roseovarius sp.]
MNFNTSKATRYQPRPDRSHLNWIITDSDWEDKLAATIEDHPAVLSYAKNHNLGFEVPYGTRANHMPCSTVRLDAPRPTVSRGQGLSRPRRHAQERDHARQWIRREQGWAPHGRWGFCRTARGA